MKISKIETVRLTSRPTLIWVRVHTDEGLIGLGESWFGCAAIEADVGKLAVIHLRQHHEGLARLAVVLDPLPSPAEEPDQTFAARHRGRALHHSSLRHDNLAVISDGSRCPTARPCSIFIPTSVTGVTESGTLPSALARAG